jgi:ribosomal protein S18 acetylase RimI-like enzyme
MNDTPTIRLLGPDDIAVLGNVAEDVFDEDIDPRWAAEFLNDPRHHIVVALLGNQVIGMASAVHYVHPDKPPELWVNEIGVTPAYRQRGIGKQLIAALFSRGRELGCKEAWLGTEESNTAARQLYASAGGVAQPMVYFTFDLDRL